MRNQKQSTAQDKISALPDDVTDLILSCLPIKEAARTSILSRKWRYKWTTIPDLVFDELRGSLFALTPADEQKIVDAVNQILLTHNGNIRKFHFWVPLDTCFDLTSWFHALRRSSIQDIRIYPSSRRYKLPSYLFHCDTLTSLKVFVCVLKLPVQFDGFPRLTDLDLGYVTFVDSDSIERLVSHCPLLSNLSLKGCNGCLEIKISSPNLLTLRVSGVFSYICLANTPRLIDISVSLREPIERFEDGMENQNGRNLTNFFIGLSDVRVLEIDGFFLQYLSFNFKKPSESITLSNLKTLSICWNFECLRQCITALYLLRSCPMLEHLEIYCRGVYGTCYVPIGDFWRASSINVQCNFKHLKFLLLRSMRVREPWMTFLQHALESSPILEKAKITFHKEPSSEEAPSIYESLLSMCRASSKARIVFKH